MNFMFQIAFLASLFCHSAFAGGTHGEGHRHEMEIGKPGTKHINRSVTVKMFETDYGMIFKPNFLKFEAGQTVKINLINKGELQHEFVMDTEAGILKHRIEMENMPDMDHNDPNSLRLNPNE
ncbi:cupredoxin, partial [Paracoccaceae bacterium]|nr:cupredoxin [Paracoccaceae bacterium]